MRDFHFSGFEAIGVIFCAFFTFLGIACAGAYSGGAGTTADPYKIGKVADWQELTATPADWDKNFILLNDIDLGGESLTPIGNISTGFTGIFDGQGHSLRNAIINLSSDWVGLFGSVFSPGQVENLGIENFTVTGQRTVGGLCGYNSGVLVGCFVASSINGMSTVGGLCGINLGSIRDCSSSGSVKGGFAWDDIGGLCGINSGTIASSSSSATVSGESNSKNVGGLCGQNNHGTIRLCWASGPVTGGDYIMRYGGLCGASSGLIEACYATGSVTGGLEAGRLGGVCGDNGDSVLSSYATGNVTGGEFSAALGGLCGMTSDNITNCYATGNVSGGTQIGGLIGVNKGYTIAYCYSTGKPIGISDVGGLCGYKTTGTNYGDTANFWDTQTSGTTISAMGTGETTEHMHEPTTFTAAGWDFIHLWGMGSDGYPSLLLFSQTHYSGGSGSMGNPFEISTLADWQYFTYDKYNWDKHFILVNDIDLSGVNLTPVAPDTSPTGIFQGTAFTGVFDGQGHLLRNVTIKLPEQDYVGLFGFVGNGAQIRNLRMEDTAVTGRDYVGGLCGWSDNGSIRTCSVSGLVIGPDNFSEAVGGLCGKNNGGEIADCAVETDLEGGIYAADFGGLCGVNTGTIRDCIAESGLSTGGGGLCGLNDHGTILRCQAFGSVFYGGGLCGSDDYGTIEDCFAAVDITGRGGGLCGNDGHGTIRNSHATGSVSGKDNLGGLIGAVFESQIENCSASGDVTGETDSSNVGGLCGYVSGGTIRRCSATGAVAAGSSSTYIGGLCGANGFFRSVGATIGDSFATGTVHGGSYVGGFNGYTMSGIATACYATGAVSGASYVGGMCGSNDWGTLSDCYATGAAAGTQYVGGFAGFNYRGKMYRCYSTGRPTGTGSVGGFCGQKDIGSGYGESGNFWDTLTSQTTTSAMGTGKTTTQMKTTTTFTGAGWDFVPEKLVGTMDIWRMCGDGVAYPRLSWEYSIRGDLRCPDGVGLEDLIYLAGRWLASTPAVFGAADTDGSGKVDLPDFAALAGEWMK